VKAVAGYNEQKGAKAALCGEYRDGYKFNPPGDSNYRDNNRGDGIKLESSVGCLVQRSTLESLYFKSMRYLNKKNKCSLKFPHECGCTWYY
jgi:hypothetical protein